MKDWKKIPIPDLMQKHCKLDHRGLPVPFIVLIDQDNNSHFKVNDSEKTHDCVMHDKCSICGTVMNDDRWMIGGPQSAYHIYGCYIDTPVHYQCGKYALQVCPYLAYSGYVANKTDIEKLQKQIAGGDSLLLDNPTVDQNRVPLFVFGKTSGIRYSMNFLVSSMHVGKIYPNKPYLETEYWNNGEQLDSTVAVNIIIDDFAKKGLKTTDYLIQ